MSALSTLWKAAVREGCIVAGPDNPFGAWGLAKGTKRKRKAINGFTADELQRYFSTPIFSEGERPKRGRGETPYWLPLIALFTGARPEEVAQLLVSDIHQRSSDGRWTITFSSGGNHPVKGSKTLKTDNSGTGERTFAVPAPLLDLGLLEYRQWLEDAGHLTLFPLLTTKNKRGGVYDSFGGWFSGYIYDHGVLPKNVGRKPVREFRDTWSTAARASGIYREAMEYIQGHGRQDGVATSNDDYGSLEILGDQIDNLRIIDKHRQAFDVLALVPRWTPPAETSRP